MNNKAAVFILCCAVLVVGGAALFFVTGAEKGSDDPRTWEDVSKLPDSPRDASYRIDDREVRLADGRAEEEVAPGSAGKAVTEMWGEPVYGDLSDNGDTSDAALILTRTEGGSGTFYYVVAALKDNTGYLGTNAVLLGDRIAPQNIVVQQGMIVITYADRTSSEAMTNVPSEGKTAYLTVSGADLRLAGPFEQGEQVLEGDLVYGHESRTFTPCGSAETYWIEGGSRAASVLKAIYEERTKDAAPYTPVYAVIVGSMADAPLDGFGADFDHALDVRLILHAPVHGSCGRAATTTPENAA